MMAVRQKQARRTDKRIWYLLGGIFVAMFLFSFMTQKFKDNEGVEAASLASFDPGYIISDYQMGNYKSMDEAEIQAFLLAKGNCRDTRTYLADQYTSYSYHIKDGHFVCLAEETFGEGTSYGDDAPDGNSAAHIIYRAAQDYKINPQVLIVLLQKEQSLITDSWPNDRQFRSATGYGCPDTAPCNAEYYGFKNQVRKAAALFRTVLDGGWTNYPLGNNYIQYNPNAGCGGSVVNIKSLATSALYRYTPYQPNDGALAAGYGTAYCGAYGNRNFYLYFEDWFGGIIDDASYSDVVTPRYMIVIKDTYYINPNSGMNDVSVKKGTILKFSTKIVDKENKWCIRTAEDTNNNRNRCIKREDLDEVKITFESIPESEQEKVIKPGAIKINIRTGEKITSYDKKLIKRFLKKATFNDNGSEIGISAKSIDEIIYEKVVTSRYMRVTEDTNYIIPQIMEKGGQVKKDTVLLFVTKIKDADGNWCIRTKSDTDNNNNVCIERSSLDEADKYLPVLSPRKMQVVRDVYYTIPYTREKGELVRKNKILSFDTKVVNSNGNWCIRTESDTKSDNNKCIERADLKEVEAYIPASAPRKMRIIRDTYYVNPQTLEKGDYVKKGTILNFVTKVEDDNGNWCIRTEEDTSSDYNLCIVRKDLEEVL